MRKLTDWTTNLDFETKYKWFSLKCCCRIWNVGNSLKVFGELKFAKISLWRNSNRKYGIEETH